MERLATHKNFLLESLKERDNSEEQDVDGSILKRIVGNQDFGLDWAS